jgi:hypothetical protein
MRNAVQILHVILRVIGDGRSISARSSCATNAVDVTYGRLREVIIDDQADSLEVNTTSHEFCADEYPDITLTK